MLTLQIGNYFFSLDCVFTYPIDLTGDGGAWSTDFELPATPEALTATGADKLLLAYIPTPVAGYIHNGGTDNYPCKVYVRGYHDDVIEAYLTLNVLPPLYSRVVAELDDGFAPFSFMAAESSHPYYYLQSPYLTGRGTGQDNGAFPMIPAATAVQRLVQIAGGTIDTSTLPADLYIVLDALWSSPYTMTYGLRVDWQDTWRQASYYAVYQTFYASIPSTYITYMTLRGGGTLDNIQCRTPNGASPTMRVTLLINGAQVAVTNYSDNSWHTLGSIAYNDGDQLAVRMEDQYQLDATEIVWTFNTPRADYDADRAVQPNPRVVPTVTTTEQYCATTFFACIKATLIKLLSDIAAVTGTVLTYTGGTLRFSTPSFKVVNNYSITGYELINDAVGQTNVAVYANDTTDTPHRDILQTYDYADLEEVKELITMAADQADLATDSSQNDIASFVQWQTSGSGYAFKGWGHGYWLGVRDSATGNLVPAVATSALLPPSASQLQSVEAVVFDDISRDIKIAMAGREWLITEREQTANGAWNIKAILL